jgi:type IX secretion system PorP/SprF family membrane protein
MRKSITIFLCIVTIAVCKAQQSTQYTQFMMNESGYNPAIAGSANGLMMCAGQRTQWRGFENAPIDDFINVSRAFGKKGYKHFWHGIGAYVEQDKFGVFTNQIGYLSYAIHLKVSSQFRIGVGVAAGARSMGLSNIVFDTNDPAFNQDYKKVIVPDIIPGIYLYSQKFSLSISEHNIYKNQMSWKDKYLGSSGVLLRPTTYVTISRKFTNKGYNLNFVPAIHLQYDLVGIPSVNFNFMTYYAKRVGVGVSYRTQDAVSLIVQVRIWKNITVGLAYDIVASRFHAAKANSDEVMIGLSPVMNPEEGAKHSTNDCPKFEFISY